jgi:hypothetical protein
VYILLILFLLLLQDIRNRAAAKDEMLSSVNQERHYINSKKRIERELHNSLRKDKVDSIQKQQVREDLVARGMGRLGGQHEQQSMQSTNGGSVCVQGNWKLEQSPK